MGYINMITILLAGSVWFVDGAELLIISSAAKSVTEEWSLTPMQAGSVVSIVFVGVLVGNLFSGSLGDAFGRVLPLQASYIGVFMFSIMSSLASDFWSLSLLRLLVGVSFGVGQPVAMTLITEMTPLPWRMCAACVEYMLFSVGEAYSAVLILFQDPEMQKLDWRWLLRAGALPALVLLVLCPLLLRESPNYLAVSGRFDEAKETLGAMQRSSGAGPLSLNFARPAPPEAADGEWWRLRIVFGPDLLLSTLISGFSCFVMNLQFYGCLYAFPQIIPDADMSGPPAVGLLAGACTELIGYAPAAILATLLSRKACIRIYLFGMVVAVLVFTTYAAREDLGWLGQCFLFGSYYGIKLFPTLGFSVVYQYISELFPTPARATGVSVCLVAGRLAGILAPMLFEQIMEKTGRFHAFFLGIALVSGANLVLIDALPYETAGQPLADNVDVSFVGGKAAPASYGSLAPA